MEERTRGNGLNGFNSIGATREINYQQVLDRTGRDKKKPREEKEGRKGESVHLANSLVSYVLLHRFAPGRFGNRLI